jgi:hypothetical protein
MKKYTAYLLILGTFMLWTLPFSVAHGARHSLGGNILTKEGTVYLIITMENGQVVRRPYSSAGTFLSYSFNNWANVATASAEDIALPVGSLIPPQDGKVFCSDRGNDQGSCYLITSGQKAGFTSENVFFGLGYSFNHVLYGDVSFLKAADNISASTMAHKPGTLVNKDGTIFLVSNNGLLGVPNPAILQSWGYVFTDAVPANLADRALLVFSNIAERQSGQLNISEKTKKRDSLRLADIRQIASAQELYFNDNNTYPKSLSDLFPVYIVKLPNAPMQADDGCTLEQNAYNYSFIDTNQYILTFCLGSQTGGYSAGVRALTEGGIK